MFDQFYQQSSDHLKLAFLEETFQKYPNLKEDFLAFYLKPSDSPLKMTVGDPDDYILASTDLIKADLESINISSPDWKNYVPRHSGYIPEYEAMEHMAEDEIGRLLGFHVGEVERYCTIKHFDLAFLYMISLYHACLEAELDDEYETLPHASHTMLNLLENHLQECDALFKVIQLSQDQLFTIATVIFDQFQKYFREDSMFLKFFEPLLFDVIHSGADASILLDVIENQKATEHVPWLVSELHRKTGAKQSGNSRQGNFIRKTSVLPNLCWNTMGGKIKLNFYISPEDYGSMSYFRLNSPISISRDWSLPTTLNYI